MLKRISHTFIHVLDQDEALDFYVGKLGMVVNTDADMGVMRFLTVNFPDQPDVELVLMVPGPPAYDDATAAQIRELVTKGAAGGGVIFETDDCRGTYESLRAAGVEVHADPPFSCRAPSPPSGTIRYPKPFDRAGGGGKKKKGGRRGVGGES